VASLVRTREQAIPVGLAVPFVLASVGGLFWLLYDLPRSMQAAARVPDDNLVDVRHPGRDTPGAEPRRSINRTTRARRVWSRLFSYRSAAVPLW
jgi:hypothetical protein